MFTEEDVSFDDTSCMIDKIVKATIAATLYRVRLYPLGADSRSGEVELSVDDDLAILAWTSGLKGGEPDVSAYWKRVEVDSPQGQRSRWELEFY